MGNLTRRMTIELSGAPRSALEELVEVTGASMSEVIRSTLMAYAGMLRRVKNGDTIIVRTKDGRELEQPLLGL
jgi:hypothetical protein